MSLSYDELRRLAISLLRDYVADQITIGNEWGDYDDIPAWEVIADERLRLLGLEPEFDGEAKLRRWHNEQQRTDSIDDLRASLHRAAMSLDGSNSYLWSTGGVLLWLAWGERIASKRRPGIALRSRR